MNTKHNFLKGGNVGKSLKYVLFLLLALFYLFATMGYAVYDNTPTNSKSSSLKNIKNKIEKVYKMFYSTVDALASRTPPPATGPTVSTGSSHQSRQPIVAVFDLPVNINTPSLKDVKNRIYRNVADIPDNGKDDDDNGIIDDTYGIKWNTYGDEFTGYDFTPSEFTSERINFVSVENDTDEWTDVFDAIQYFHDVAISEAIVNSNAKILPISFNGNFKVDSDSISEKTLDRIQTYRTKNKIIKLIKDNNILLAYVNFKNIENYLKKSYGTSFNLEVEFQKKLLTDVFCSTPNTLYMVTVKDNVELAQSKAKCDNIYLGTSINKEPSTL
jgi:hypothetical protein